MTLCNNLSRKRGVGIFSRVGVFSREYGTKWLLVQQELDNGLLRYIRARASAGCASVPVAYP